MQKNKQQFGSYNASYQGEKIMKYISFVIVVTFLFVGCTSNKYCTMCKFNDTFNTIFVDQFHKGVDNTANNITSISNYIYHDYKTSGDRLNNTLDNWYQSVNFKDFGKRVEVYGTTLERQWHQGCEDTAKNIHTIGEYFCISDSEPEN